jgi:DNA-binding MarR family transcriptional regulator
MAIRPDGGNRRPRDARGLTPSRAAVLDLILDGCTEAPVIAAKRDASRQAIYEHLDHLIATGWVVKVTPNDNRTVSYHPTDQAKRSASRNANPLEGVDVGSIPIGPRDQHGLTPGQAQMLRALLRHPGQQTTELAAHAHVPYGTAYDRLSTLVRDGWARRTPLDQVPVAWSPTARALRLAEQREVS